MSKTKSVYICDNCSFKSPKWLGQCPDCNSWNTFVESVVSVSRKSAKTTSFNLKSGLAPVQLSTIKASQTTRVSSNISEFDRVLGGGFVKGQVVLLSGAPGVGKSTLLTQLSSKTKTDVIYVCGEESPQQIKLRAQRMKYEGENMYTISETNVESLLETLSNYTQENNNIGLLIIDSIQTMYSEELTGIPGAVGQVRLTAQKVTDFAKARDIPTILVGHLTKEGAIAGPKILEHLVDTVLHLEGDFQNMYRVLRTTKNRFGPVSEVGIFEMQGDGLVEILNPTQIFLSHETTVPGSCISVIMEGNRPLLFEIQALATKTSFGYPKRTASGLSVNRLQVLIATLQSRVGINLFDYDIYVNVAGGFKIVDYASDLAVCLAIVSSVKNASLKTQTAVFSECGLLGELRGVSHESQRLKEANKLGYENVVYSKNAKTLKDAIDLAFDKKLKNNSYDKK